MYKILIILFYFLQTYSYAQSPFFKYKLEKRGTSMNFPIFEKDTFSLVADKINQTLQLGELALIKTQKVVDIFKVMFPKAEDQPVWGVSFAISTSVFTNTAKVLSMKFDETSCGATCYYWVQYYNFDSKKGDIIRLKDLFTKQGYKQFCQYITKKRVKSFRKAISKLDKVRQKDFNYIIENYQNDNFNDFYIEKGSIYIDGYNSFSKHEKFDGIETISEFVFSEFSMYLNDYGKYLFLEDNVMPIDYKLYNFPKLYKGKIAGQDVILLIKLYYDATVSCIYAYEKYGIGIDLVGKISNGKLNLIEKTADNEDNGFIEATYEDDKIIGIWLNKDKTKKHEVMLLQK